MALFQYITHKYMPHWVKCKGLHTFDTLVQMMRRQHHVIFHWDPRGAIELCGCTCRSANGEHERERTSFFIIILSSHFREFVFCLGDRHSIALN